MLFLGGWCRVCIWDKWEEGAFRTKVEHMHNSQAGEPFWAPQPLVWLRVREQAGQGGLSCLLRNMGVLLKVLVSP